MVSPQFLWTLSEFDSNNNLITIENGVSDSLHFNPFQKYTADTDFDVLCKYQDISAFIDQYVKDKKITSENITHVKLFVDEWKTVINIYNNTSQFNSLVAKILNDWSFIICHEYDDYKKNHNPVPYELTSFWINNFIASPSVAAFNSLQAKYATGDSLVAPSDASVSQLHAIFIRLINKRIMYMPFDSFSKKQMFMHGLIPSGKKLYISDLNYMCVKVLSRYIERHVKIQKFKSTAVTPTVTEAPPRFESPARGTLQAPPVAPRTPPRINQISKKPPSCDS